MFTLPLKYLSHTLIFCRFVFKPLNAWLVIGRVSNTSAVLDLLTKEEEVLHSQGETCRRVAHIHFSCVCSHASVSGNGSENVSECLGTCHKSQVCELLAFEIAATCIICWVSFLNA